MATSAEFYLTGAHSILNDSLRGPAREQLNTALQPRETLKRRDSLGTEWQALIAAGDVEEEPCIDKAAAFATGRTEWRRTILFCFFLMGIAMNIPFASISLVSDYFLQRYRYFTILQGCVTLWPILLSAYNLPGLPVLLLQLKFDASLTKRFGRIPAYRWRLLSCLCSLLAILLFLALSQSQGLESSAALTSLIVATTLVGIFQGLAYGWFFQLASLYPFNCISTLLAGNGMATIVSLLVTLVQTNCTLDVTQLSEVGIQVYFFSTAFWVFLGVIAAVITLTKLNVENYIGDVQDYKQLSVPTTDKTSLLEKVYTSKDAIRITWPSLLACFIVSVCYVAVTGLLPLTPVAAQRDVKNMFTIIMYTSLLSLFIGNEISVFITCIRSQAVVLLLSVLRAPVLPLFVAYDAETFFHNDYVVYAVVFVFIFSGAYLNALAYRASALRESKLFKERVVSFMNISLYCGVYVGLLISYFTPWIMQRLFGMSPNGDMMGS